MNYRVAVLLYCLCAFAQTPERPGHIFHPQGRLTNPSGLAPRQVGRDYLLSLAPQYHLLPADLDAAYVAREFRSAHNGVTHLLYRQQFQGVDVENAEWTVNVDAAGQVINAGGGLARRPKDGVSAPDAASAMAAVRVAAGVVNPELARRFTPIESSERAAKGLRFAGSSFPADIEAIPVWWEINGEVQPAWKFGVTDADSVTRWSVVVDAAARKVLAKTKLTLAQSAPRGLVYEQGSPQPNPKPGIPLTSPPPAVERTTQPFTGDPVASPKGWVIDNQTRGNNVIAGTNLLGLACTNAPTCPVLPPPTTAPDGNFSFPVDISGSFPLSGDASASNLFYWANQAHDWFYQLGFDEAAGNFQQGNFNRGGVEGDPMVAYALFGAAYPGRARLNNSIFVPYSADDGGRGYIAFFLETVGGLYFDNALDAPTVIHEYAHGVSTRLVRRLSSTAQGASMGEAWSDFFAIEFLTPAGAPADGVYPFSEYPDQVFGLGIRTRPYSTRMDVNPLTYANLGHVIFEPEVHADGEIWFEALWEIRANLIQQLGEKEGRRRVRQIVLDGMKLAPPAPSMLDMRDAILLADQVDFGGASQEPIWAGFAKRGMGVLAQSNTGHTIHVHASFEAPSAKGAIGFYEDRYVIGERVQIVVQDSNAAGDAITVLVRSNGGDVENLVLRRKGPVFTGYLPTDPAPVVRQDGLLSLTSGDFVTAYYNDGNAPGGPHLAEVTAPVSVDYDYFYRPNTQLRFAGETALGLPLAGVKPFALPFQFPYFGKRYSQVWVHENGLLTFDLPSFSPCADLSGLWVANGIAPLYMDLTTLGGAQAAEDVYASQPTADSVTFRWAAETLSDFPGTRPEAVNFAATLYQDGRIQFNYGTGNRNLTGGSNIQGCSATAPTVGLSNGHENFLELVPTHDGKGTLENAQTVVLDPPFNSSSAPVLRLESPAGGDTVQDVLAGKGVVYDPDPESAIRGIDILVDGIAIDTAVTGISRDDFCTAQRVQGCPNVGFTFLVPLLQSGFQPGAHTLQLRATNRRGYFVDTPARPFTLEAGTATPAVAAIEAPTAGQDVSGMLTVRGYAYSTEYRVVEVDVLVDGITAGRASYTTARADICGGLSPAPPNCPRVGFTINLNTRALTNGAHTISVKVFDETGRLPADPLSPVPVNVANPSLTPPVAAVTAPRRNQEIGGTFRIAGYAYAPAGRVASVTLVIDGYPIGAVPFGTSRPEACAQLPDIAACPNIGFELDFDTTRLVNGPHFLYVVVRDDKGGSVDSPAGLSGGLDFLVKN